MKHICLFITMVVLFACEKDQEFLAEINPYDEFRDSAVGNDVIGFSNSFYQSSYNNEVANNWSVTTNESIKEVPNITLSNNTSILVNATHQYSDLAGETVSLEFKSNMEVVDFYLPELINLTYPEVLPNSDLTINTQTILEWEIDTKNVHDILIEFRTEDNLNRIYVKDLGSYQLEPDLFKNIPTGTMIEVWILRYNYRVFLGYYIEAYSLNIFDVRYIE